MGSDERKEMPNRILIDGLGLARVMANNSVMICPREYVRADLYEQVERERDEAVALLREVEVRRAAYERSGIGAPPELAGIALTMAAIHRWLPRLGKPTPGEKENG